jgi:MFS family permease
VSGAVGQLVVIPPELRKNWRLVVAAAATMAVNSAAWYCGSIFFVALRQEFGWGYAATSSIFSVFGILHGVFGILAGYLVDRIGPRRLIISGGLLFLVANLASSLATARWHLFVTHSLFLALASSSLGWVPISVLLSRVFREGRGTVFGAASAGVGVGILVGIPFVQAAISWGGWRIGYVALGVAGAAVVLPVAWRVFGHVETTSARQRTADAKPAERPAAASFQGGLGAAARTGTFWLVAGGFILMNIPIQMVMTHQVAHLVELGHTKSFVAQLVGLVGLASIGGKMLWGWLSDRWSLERTYLVGIGTLVTAILLLLAIGPESTAWLLACYAVTIGIGYSVSPALTPILSARFFSGPSFGTIFGTLSMIHNSAGSVGVWLAGYVHDLTGTYRPALIGGIGSAITALAIVWLVAPRRARLPGC